MGKKSFLFSAFLKLLPIRVHFNEESMAKILVFKDVADLPGVKIIIETSKERAICIFWRMGLRLNLQNA